MMIGARPPNPTVQVPPWHFRDNYQTANIHSPFPVTPNSNAFTAELHLDTLTALHHYLPSNTDQEDTDSVGEDFDIPVDAFSCDQFRMYEFKVRKCARARSHDWTECPYAHPGEKARRRDPLKHHYSGHACPDFRNGACKNGDSCEFAHGVFECWLHPMRYRTQPCKDGTHCRRRICFFAHTPDQLRSLAQLESRNGSQSRLVTSSPGRLGLEVSYNYNESLPSDSDSPAVSPSGMVNLRSMSGLAESMRNLQIGSLTMSVNSPRLGARMGHGFFSPRSPSALLRPGFMGLPSTPNRAPTRPSIGAFDLWEKEPEMERVESGRDLRAKMYAKLSLENSVGSYGSSSNLDWVAELVK